jgi:MFS family permease
LNTKAIILLFIANAISGMAQGMSMIAIPWYFAQIDSLRYFGIVYLVTNVISMFWVPWSGTIVDKYDRKRIFQVLTTTIGTVIISMAIFGIWNNGLSMFLVASIFVITFLNYNMHYPCLYAFVQEITPPEKYAKMTSLLEVIGQLTTIGAGAGATLLLEGASDGQMNVFGFGINIGFDLKPWQIQEIIFLDGVTYFIAFTIISFISYVPLRKRTAEIGGVFTRIKTGLRYLNGERSILWFGILSFMVFTMVLMETFYMGVNYVSNHLQESGDVYANAKMAYSLGAIFVGVSIGYFIKKMSLPAVVIGLTFMISAVYLYLSINTSVILFFVMMLIVGICNAGCRISRITYLFKNVPNQFFGRAGSVFFQVHIVIRVILLGVFTIPFFHTGNNIIFGYRLMGAILLLTGVVMFSMYKRFDRSLTAS